jgi:1-acyl-sn-glycerol-3-phosphate acyltransferase
MVLTIAPEGTRSRVLDWKQGFYRVAVGAGVPIVPVALDYPARCVRFGAPFAPSGDYRLDMQTLKPFFCAQMAFDPQKYDETLP